MGKITQHRTPAQLSQAAQEQRGVPLPTLVAPQPPRTHSPFLNWVPVALPAQSTRSSSLADPTRARVDLARNGSGLSRRTPLRLAFPAS